MALFFDEMVPQTQQWTHVPGTAVVVVKDGAILFAKGYGIADQETRRPVSPETTLLLQGSISKIFTFTALMKLVDQGKVDLDRDVNEYLDFRVTPPGSPKLTIGNLLTHTTGFEFSYQDLACTNPADHQDLEHWVKTHSRPLTFKPGTTMTYSPYGVSLAGYIIQRTSGIPFEEYMEREVFAPLGIQYASFRQPVPEPLRAYLSKGYDMSGRPLEECMQATPANGLSISAIGVGRFMIAHLSSTGEMQPFISSQTLAKMHSTQFTPKAGVNGATLGFWERSLYNNRIIGHWGNTTRFSGDLNLVLNENLGVYICSNGAGGGALSSAIWYTFVDRYLANSPLQAPKTSGQSSSDALAVEGVYQSGRDFVSGISRFAMLFSQIHVRRNGNGSISVDGRTEPLFPVGDLRFRNAAGHPRSDVVFFKDELGRMQMLFGETDTPFYSLLRIPWYETKAFALGLAIPGFLLSVWICIRSFFAQVVRRVRKSPPSPRARFQRVISIAGKLHCLLFLTWAVLLVLLLGRSDARFALLSSPYDPLYRLMTIIAAAAVIASAAAAGSLLGGWFSSSRDRKLLLLGSVQVTALLALSFVIVRWNLATLNIAF